MNDGPDDTADDSSREGVSPLQEFVLEGFVPPPGRNPPRFGRPPRLTPEELGLPTGAGTADRDPPRG